MGSCQSQSGIDADTNAQSYKMSSNWAQTHANEIMHTNMHYQLQKQPNGLPFQLNSQVNYQKNIQKCTIFNCSAHYKLQSSLKE